MLSLKQGNKLPCFRGEGLLEASKFVYIREKEAYTMLDVLGLEKGTAHMVKPKRISVSSKRQITIPKEFYDSLNISDEVLCRVVDGNLVIKPIGENVDFSEFILSDLINEGYEAGDELLREFSYRKSQIRPALNEMISESRDNKIYDHAEDFFNELDEVENE